MVIDTAPDAIETDYLNSFYYVSEENLYRLSADGRPTGSHTAKIYGNIYSVDPTNPMKTLVYYRDFNTIMFLDNMMTQVGDPVMLQDLGLERTSVVSRSYNNGIWVFDSGNNELIRLDAQLNISHRTGRLNQVTGFIPEPVSMIERNNKLFMNDPQRGIHVFDIYGTFLKTLPFKELNDFDVYEEKLFYIGNDSLHSYDLRYLSDSAIALPGKDSYSVRILGDRALIKSGKKLSLYSTRN